MFDKKANFVKHIKQNHSINQNVWSLRLLKITNFETKTFLFKTIMQRKITYSYPIYHPGLSIYSNIQIYPKQCTTWPTYKQ